MLGKPVFRGTPVTVELVLCKLAEGIAIEALLDGYPGLTPEDVHAAIQCAADTTADDSAVFRSAGAGWRRTRSNRRRSAWRRSSRR